MSDERVNFQQMGDQYRAAIAAAEECLRGLEEAKQLCEEADQFFAERGLA